MTVWCNCRLWVSRFLKIARIGIVILQCSFGKEGRTPQIAEIVLIGPGDILFLYTDGVHDGGDSEERLNLEALMRKYCRQPVKEICDALLEYAATKDDHLRRIGEQDRIDDKTVFVIKRN